jgi:prephenate dehydrogenase
VTVGIVGLGLIGGSLALDLVARGEVVVGTDADAATRIAAATAGITIHDDVAGVADAADLVVIAVPPAEVAATVAAVAAAAPGLPVTDVASIKSPAALGFAPGDVAVAFVGGHPMAGTERSGFAAARRGLLAGAPWLLTPHDDADLAAFADVVDLVLGVGAAPVVLDVDAHDRLVAAVSHLPHLLAFAVHGLAAAHGPAVVDLVAGPSFRDATRVAASDPAFWADLLRRNATAVRALLGEVQDWLDGAADEADRGDVGRLQERLATAHRAPLRTAPGRETVALAGPGRAIARLRELGEAGYRIVALHRDGGARVDLERR